METEENEITFCVQRIEQVNTILKERIAQACHTCSEFGIPVLTSCLNTPWSFLVFPVKLQRH